MGWENDYQTIIVLPTGATTGERIVIDGTTGTIQIYNTAGVLVGVLAAGTTVIGGASYAEGLTIGEAGFGQVVVTTDPTGQTGLIYFPPPVPNTLNAPSIKVNTQGAGTAEYSFLTVASAEDATQKDYIALNYDASNQSGVHVPTVSCVYADPFGGFETLWFTNLSGMFASGAFSAVQPNTGGARNNVAVAETWHTAVLGTGWGNISGLLPLQYRKTNDGMLEVVGCVQSTSATPSAVITTFPAGWQPSADNRVNGGVQRAAAGDIDHSFDVGISGALTILNNVTASAVGIYINFRTPL
jgi:hypothetical protein